MSTRRNFIKKSALFTSLIGATTASSLFANNIFKAPGTPTIISTWNHGIQANVAAWKVLVNNRSSTDEGKILASEVVKLVAAEVNNRVTLILGTPFVHLRSVVEITDDSAKVFVAAQNCSEHKSGAYTGEVSVSMLKSTGLGFVIIGHSERRLYFKETNHQLAKKVDLVLAEELLPIFCCGEPLDIREDGTFFNYVRNQLTDSLFHLNGEQISKLIIAYEPIWAIGTGKTASALQAQEMHSQIRSHLAAKYGNDVASEMSILYGGSCKPENARELFANPDVDGGLIGGASLNAGDFVDIAKSF